MRRVTALFTVAACLLLVAVLASRTAPAANVQEVLIGELLPLTGNFAALGQQYLWAGQTVEDVVNKDYPDLALPLGPGKGFPGLGGAKMTLVVRDDQSRCIGEFSFIRSNFPSCARQCQYGPWLAPLQCACVSALSLWGTLVQDLEGGFALKRCRREGARKKPRGNGSMAHHDAVRLTDRFSDPEHLRGDTSWRG